MRLVFLRHGIAEERRKGLAEADRALTSEGIAKTREVARGLAALALGIDRCWTSPFRRARQTAELAIAQVPVELTEHAELLPDASWTALRKALAKLPADASVLLVGHEPSMSRMVAASMGAPDGAIALKKSGVAVVELEAADRPGMLRFLLTPKVAAAAGRKR